jgi:molybdopterin-containing oxidoreductase family membrane subunit
MSRWVRGDATAEQLSDQLLSPVWTPASRVWVAFVLFTGAGTLMLFGLIAWTMIEGIGLFGTNIPAAWGFAIINFVWWIGIGHAGTFISAILLLLEQKWRTSINRFAEAMTLFAVMQAGLFPILHLGRPWFFYWLVPYPSTLEVWPQFKSALPWDAAAIFTYLTTSLLFWYLGLVPDLAGVRDRAPGRVRRRIYAIFALGWSGSALAWRRFRIGYGLIAGIATPLVLSVHSIVSADFAITLLPGWHSTIFPPYFVAGAILSGFAMVLLLLIPARAVFRIHNVVTDRHLDVMAKMILVTGWIVLYSYIVEVFIAWYSGSEFERYQMLVARPFGPYGWVTWLTIFCNTIVVQLFWFRFARCSLAVLWIVSLLVNVGMWCERFVLIDISLMRGFTVSKWETFVPTLVDWGIFAGTLSFFCLLFLLFLRFVPFVAVYEVKELAQEPDDEDDDDG